jgi:hypothetical protein
MGQIHSPTFKIVNLISQLLFFNQTCPCANMSLHIIIKLIRKIFFLLAPSSSPQLFKIGKYILLPSLIHFVQPTSNQNISLHYCRNDFQVWVDWHLQVRAEHPLLAVTAKNISFQERAHTSSQ